MNSLLMTTHTAPYMPLLQFCQQPTAEILQPFSIQEEGSDKVEHLQRWLTELPHLAGNVLLHFPCPSLERQIDAVVLYRGIVFVIEMKLGGSSYTSADVAATSQLAHALKAHHQASHDKFVVPILIATKANPQGAAIQVSSDLVCNTMCDSGEHLAALIEHFSNQFKYDEIMVEDWAELSFIDQP
ncbi:hypothetical protein [Vibrio paucivorans]|uniref:Uncharacterized protein n=1 Tax=Vibrio paucivorans TaxID=2829489 RepID=A0A9X3CGL6_9VIBR|nr:hypothetical protein [Vibrio paucivorans]MCW8335406.1 hypothetical protein [Vibrio paucivorans]